MNESAVVYDNGKQRILRVYFKKGYRYWVTYLAEYED